jgi:seryl-tRNA synthetase
MREEEKAQQELEKAQNDAEDEEKRYKKALDQAKKELEKAKAEDIEKLNNKITILQKQLEEANAKKERAISRAQMTKSGHIYVISNIGSFGENIYKIGMTRRLEPTDRVYELGDASVPFNFDIHAMIFSENAPELERKIQKEFDELRLNLVNSRREFFNVNLDEIKNVVLKHHGDIEFTKLAEAKEFRESQAIRNEKKNTKTLDKKIEEYFPASL